MSKATLTISVEGGQDVRRAFGQISGESKKANAAIVAEARRTKEQIKKLHDEEVRDAVKAASDTVKAEMKAFDAKLKLSKQAADRVAKEVAAGVTTEEDAAQRKEQVYRQLAMRYITEEERKTKKLADEEKKRTATTLTEAKKRESAERNGRAGSGGSGSRGGTGGGLGDAIATGAARTTLGIAARAANAAISSVGRVADDAGQQAALRQSLQARATQIAAGAIGDASAAPELMESARRISLETGTDPAETLEAYNLLQDRFAGLATPAQRQASYRTMPMYARFAKLTNSTLEETVGAAGEMQRQLGITEDQMPAALMQQFRQGQLGALGFKETSRSLGQIGSRSSRFLSTDPAHAEQSLAATGALMQMSAQGGGSAAEAATRSRAFLDNFTAHAGQQRLQALLGHRVLDASGQIVTHQGESQTDALARTVEEAWTKSHGNADRFLTAVAGNSTRSRGLGDQLIRDMRTHGGRATGLRTLMTAGIHAPMDQEGMNAVLSTAENQNQIRQNRAFWAVSGSEWGRADLQTQRQIAERKERSPFWGTLMDNSFVRGIGSVQNVLNERLLQVFGSKNQSGQPGQAGAMAPQGALPVNLQRPVELSPQSADLIGQAVARHASNDPHDTAHKQAVHASTASGSQGH